jgi:hypothetical protein
MCGLIKELGFEHKVEEWWLFIDSSEVSLKAVLLHNRKKEPSVPLATATGIKETHKSMSHILNAVKYKGHCCHSCP